MSAVQAQPQLPRSVDVRSFLPDHFTQWLPLAQGYKTFYETVLPEEAYLRTWQRLLQADDVYGLGAWVDGRLVGIAHYLFHATVWTAPACYLQDLFVGPASRGGGVAAALIHRVGQVASERGAARMYWGTHHTNARARRLYDQVGDNKGFILYNYRTPPVQG